MRNGVDGGAAFDLSEIEGGAGNAGNLGVDETQRAANESVDRVGQAKIRPTVAAGSRDEDFEAARSERFGGDVVDAGAVQDQNGFEFGTIGVNERAHTTEIAFAFFADIGDEQDGALRQDSGFVNGTRNRDEGGKTCAIIGNSW